MPPETFSLVDAFTSCAFKGNPAGICFVDQFPQKKRMQAIAAELNWSQTAFIKPLLAPHHYHIRWFSPRDETPICGHATLASAHVLWDSKRETHGQIIFESLAGSLYVTRDDGGWITMNFPEKPLERCDMPADLGKALNGMSTQAVYRDDLIYVVMLTDGGDVHALQPNLSLIETLECRAVCITAVSNKEGIDFESRYFAPKVGIPEDPVCGSSHCRLGPLWAKVLDKTQLTAYAASKRTGIVRLRVEKNRVFLSGQARLVAEYRLKNPDDQYIILKNAA